ncbi:hypothetical protein B484DRAFT_457199 [Ochromonadaceae sp. CCMP2298]|nr:hypothetical protein B484DRAFT_457199 [Ochromonadaceae sp. CCMP2298]
MLFYFAVFALAVTAQASEWTLDKSTAATTLVGVGVGGATVAIAAAASNNVGAQVDIYDGSAWTVNTGVVQAGVLMDGAISADKSLIALGSLFNVDVSVDGGKSFAAAPGFGGPVQSIHVFDSSIAAVGVLTVTTSSPPKSVSGVAVSRDAGGSWDMYAAGPNTRYGSFPSADTWFISGGTWNDTSSASALDVFESAPSFQLSSKLNMGAGARVPNKREGGGEGEVSGWFGAIYKTSDGGKSFETVFRSPPTSKYYFNAISCSSAQVCIAVAEGETDTSSWAGAFVTTDGGKSWALTWESTTVYGLMAAKMVSDTEGWIVPYGKGNGIEGQFYHTTDAGATWTLTQSLPGCICMDVDFKEGLGVAACATQVGAQVAVYK